jgi:hypothetical protein
MTTSRWTRHLRQAALAGTLGLVALAACAQGSARAEDDEQTDSIWNLDRRLYRGLMNGLGLRDGSESAIEYRERSPLVVPPSRNLPPPQANAGVRNPAWPKDPDAQRRDVKRKAVSRPDNHESRGNALLPSELDPPGTASAPNRPRSTTPGGAPQDGGNVVSPSQLGYFGGLFSGSAFGFGLGGPKEEVGVFTAEPPRSTLTAPPTGYQTPSPAQPYGVTKRPEYQKPIKTEELVVGR